MASSIRLGSSSPRQTQLEVLDYILNSMSAEAFVLRLRIALDPSMGYTAEDIQSFLGGLANVGFKRAIDRAFRLVEQDWQARKQRDTVGKHGRNVWTLADFEFNAGIFNFDLALVHSTIVSDSLITPPPSQVQPATCSAIPSPISVALPHLTSGLPPTTIPPQPPSLSLGEVSTAITGSASASPDISTRDDVALPSIDDCHPLSTMKTATKITSTTLSLVGMPLSLHERDGQRFIPLRH
ncbi:hypothetical protein NMY22_g10828 [Coprinellus aureogranulatus]|nr:hypothetical protein NMY22_g10828 [Coprinellus aureogranulatus]